MSLETNLRDLATRTSTELKAHRVLINGNAVDLSALTTTAKASLVAAINEVAADVDAAASSGGATNLDQLTDVAILTPATGHMIRFDGTSWTNADPTAFLQAADTNLTEIAALATTVYGRGLLTLANQAALMGMLSAATETVAGTVELATQAEADAGTDATKAVTPARLAARLAGYQPADPDLAAIAGIATTAYGRGLLTLADAAGLVAAVGAATEIAAGTVQLATSAEAVAGLDATKAVTPAGMNDRLEALIGTAPGALDTLGELADALNDDANFASTVTAQIAAKQDADPTLAALAGVTTAANQVVYATGPDAFAATALTLFARTLIASADAAAARTALEVHSAAAIGNPEADFVATFEAGLV